MARPFFISLGIVALMAGSRLDGAAPLQPESVRTNAAPEQVSFPSGEKTLHGFLFKPAGRGPFPAVIYNHGSEKTPGSFPTLGEFWTAHGFVFFLPHRSGHGLSPGDYIVDLQKEFRARTNDVVVSGRNDVLLHERANSDVASAVAWLAKQSFVDTNRMVMSGISFGGIQTLLAAEKGLGMKAFVSFSPGAMSWRFSPLLQDRLKLAVKNATTPIFLLQATNDWDLNPSMVLGKTLTEKGPPNRVKVYPAFGDVQNHAAGHGGFALHGSAIWGDDVLSFLKTVLPETSAAKPER
jgi:carboxymethylenebutenolidase